MGVLPQGQNPGTEEYNQVDALVDPMIEELVAKDIVFIEDVDAIEDKYFLALAHVLAGHAASDFGMQADIGIASRHTKGEKDLEIMASVRPQYSTLEVMPF